MERFARRADKRLALQVLVLARCLTDDHDPGRWRADTRNGLGSSEAQRTPAALVDVPAQGPQVGERHQIAASITPRGPTWMESRDVRGRVNQLLAGVVQLEVPPPQHWVRRHEDVVQFELTLVGAGTGLAVVGHIRLI